MLIYHYTDLHLPGPQDDPADIDGWARWQRYLDFFQKHPAQLYVNTGDCCRNRPHSSIYKAMVTKLLNADLDHCLLPGNHDEPEQMKALLPQTFVETTFQRIGDWQVVFINTSSGILQPSALQEIQQALQQAKFPYLIFMHHPPLFAGSPHMDRKYPLQNIKDVWPVFRSSPVPVHIFCGHYHMNRVIEEGNCSVYITASPYWNIDPAFESLQKVDFESLAFRQIRLEGLRLTQSLDWIGGAMPDL